MEFKCFVNGSFRTNSYIVYSDDRQSCIIIDPASEYPPMLQELKHLGLVPSHIILTHGHGDHTGGIRYFQENFPGILVVANIRDREFMLDRRASLGSGDISADIWVKDDCDFEAGSLKMKLISTPGHTEGGMCIYFEDEGILFSGDTLFFSSVGRTDLPGGSMDKLLDSLKNKIFVLPDSVKVFPGHESATTLAYEKRYNPFV